MNSLFLFAGRLTPLRSNTLSYMPKFDGASGRAEAVYGSYGEWLVIDTSLRDRRKRFGECITEFMKISKNCCTNK